MKKIIITIVLFIGLVFKSFADEGMWLPLLLGQQVYNDMVKKGLTLTKDQLYNMHRRDRQCRRFGLYQSPLRL
jgi:hypothetical protein